MMQSRIIELEDFTAKLTDQIRQLKDDKNGLQQRNNALVRLAEQRNWQIEQAKAAVSNYTI